MTGAISGSGSNSKSTPRYTMMNIQTSAQGLVVPIAYGRNRRAPNLIWYGGFRSVAAKQGGKGGGGKGASSYTYYADVMMALGEGVISQVFQVYKGQSAQLLSQDNMTLISGTIGQSPWSRLTSTYPSQALSYSGTAMVVAVQLDLGSSPDLPDYSFETADTLWGSVSGSDDCNPADILQDYITNQYYGLSPGATWLDSVSLQQWRSYCGAQGLLFSAYFNQQEQVTNTFQRWAQMTNTFIFWSGNVLKFTPLGATTLSGNGYNYTPQITPVYNLTYDDIIAESRGKDPITVSRVDPADGYNQVQLDIRDRLNAYNNTSVYWSDPASVNLYGQLQANIVEATEICLQSVANIAASLLGQRSVYVRNTYTFKLGYGFVLLEPGDIVTITDPHIGLSLFPVRIQSVQEGTDQILTVVAEEFPASIGIPASQTYQASVSNPTYDPNTPPGNVNPPAIFEPNAALSGGPTEVWIGLSGGAYYGAAEAYLSFDGVNYSDIGPVLGVINQGTLAVSVGTSSSTLDTTTTLVTNMLGVGSLPTTATNADAAAGRTLILVDQELMAYGTVAVGTVAGQYDISYLERGLYGTSIAPHHAGANLVTTVDAPTNTSTLTFASAPAVGPGQFLPGVPAGIAPGAKVASVSGYVVTMDQPTIADVPAGSTIQVLGALVSRIDESAVFQYTLPPQYIGQKLYLKFASVNIFGNNSEALSSASEYTYTPTGVLYTVYPPTGLSASPSASGATLSWTPNLQSATTYYQVYYGTTSTFGSATAYPATTTGTGQTLVGLTPGTTYYFWVVAGNAVNVSAPAGPSSCVAGPAGGVSATPSGGTLTSYSSIVGAGAISVSGTPGAPLTIGTSGTLAGGVTVGGSSYQTLGTSSLLISTLGSEFFIDSSELIQQSSTISQPTTLSSSRTAVSFGPVTLAGAGAVTIASGAELVSLPDLVTLYDELGTGGINFSGTNYSTIVAGSNISISPSGSTLAIAATGTLSGGLVAETAGTTLGVFTALGIGSNLTATLASGTLTVQGSAGGGGGGSIVVENGGTSIGTVGTINAQGNITLAVGGTIATLTGSGGSGGTSGLWGPYTTAAVPKFSDFTSGWVNQGTAVETDTLAGINIADPSNPTGYVMRLLSRPAPATPYKIMMLGVSNGAPATGNGWVFGFQNTSTGALDTVVVMGNGKYRYEMSGPTALSTYAGLPWFSGSTDSSNNIPVWGFLEDDGTNIYLGYSADGVTPYVALSFAKSGSFLGATGYNNIVFGYIPYGNPGSATLMAYGTR